MPKKTYLLSHSAGLLPKGTPEERFFRLWREKGGDAWPEWLQLIDAFRDSLAKLLGGSRDEFCPQANVSSGLSKVIESLPKRKGRTRIALAKESFPSVGYVVSVKTDYEAVWVERDWRAALQEDVQLVIFTHVLSNSGERLPIEELAQLAKSKGIYVAVDIAQSAGIVPIDVATWQADFVLGSCVKWLCGGPGAGFLWINPEVIDELRPTDVGWFSHEDPFEMAIDSFRYAADARRFWGGTPNVLPYVIATHSIETLLEIGIEKIAAHNRLLTDLLIDQFQITPPLQRGGTVCIPPPAPAGIYSDKRAHGIRLSPHIYNSVEEIEALIPK